MRLTLVLRFALACALLSGDSHAFAPTSGVVRRRATEVRAVTSKGDPRRPRVPRRAPGGALSVALDAFDSVPWGVWRNANTVSLTLFATEIAGVELPGVDPVIKDYLTLLFAPVGALVYLRLLRQDFLEKPETRVRMKLKKPYDPPQSIPWTGTNFGLTNVTAYVLEFVKNNPMEKTLVFVDPLENAKLDLLDDIFRGEIHVVAPTMTKFSLEEDLCKFFGVKDQGLDALADLVEKGIKPEFGGKLRPVKLIVKVPSRATTKDIVTILSDVNELKEKAGDSIIILVTVANGTFVRTIPRDLKSALQVLS